MAWSPLDTISPTTSWQFSKPTTASYFRLKHIDSPFKPNLWVCQADLSEGIQLADIKELPSEYSTQILKLDIPKVFPSTRVIGFKSDIDSSRWLVQIDASDYIEPISSGTGAGGTTTTKGYQSTVAKLLGSAGMQQIIYASTDDASIVVGDIGFDFPFYSATYRNNIYVGSNGYVIFGYSSSQYANLSATSPGRGLFIIAADRSYQQVFIKQDSPGNSFRIRYEGATGSYANVGSSNVEWEVTLFKDGVIQLVIGKLDATNGQSILTDGTGNNVIGYNPIANTSFVFEKTTSGYDVKTGSYIL
jgi:hypothetical protein